MPRYADFRRTDQRTALRAIERLLADALAAWRWASEHADIDFFVRSTAPLSTYFEQKGRLLEGITLFERAESAFDAGAGRQLAAMVALGQARAMLLFRSGAYSESDAVARRTLRWARAVSNNAACNALLNTLGLAAWQRSRDAEAQRFFEQAHRRAVTDGDRPGEAVFLGNLALIDKKRGRFVDAEQRWHAALALHRQVGNLRSVCTVLLNLANVAAELGRPDDAQRWLHESLAQCEAAGFSALRPAILITLAKLHLHCARRSQAEQLSSLALPEARRAGNRQIEIAALLILGGCALDGRDFAFARDHIEQALRLSRAHDDVPNLLEALSMLADWLARQGEAQRAAALWHLILAQTKLHAELRSAIERHLNALDVCAEARRAAADRAASLDFTVQVEAALALVSQPARLAAHAG